MSALKFLWALLAVCTTSGYRSAAVQEEASYTYILECDPTVDNDCESATLEQIANNISQSAMAERFQAIVVETNTHNLQLAEQVIFRDLGSITISGAKTVFNCTGAENAGLVFRNVSRIVIKGVAFTECGTEINAVPETCTFVASLILLQCGDVNIREVSVTKGRGIGLVVADHRGGVLQVFSSNFTNNTAAIHTDTLCGEVSSGGGLYIGKFQKDPQIPTMYSFQNCLFARNMLNTNFSYSSILSNTDELRRQQGGGALIVLENGLTDIWVKFSWCTFIENYATIGGGLSIDIEGGRNENSGDNITVTIHDSLFEMNGCSVTKSAFSGGGINFNFDTFTKPKLTSKNVVIQNVNFSKNCAELGGGLYFNSGHEEHFGNDDSILLIDECTFSENMAYVGSAVGLTPNILDISSHTLLLIPVIRDCKFFSNTPNDNVQVSHSRGTIYSNLYNIKFDGHIDFQNNLETALYIVNGQADFSNGSATFVNNTGIEGGALALIGLSSFKVGQNKSYSFVNNTAIGRGGAIFSFTIDSHDFTTSRSCFIRHGDSRDHSGILPVNEWSANITFMGNRANGGTGHAIFATTLHSCQVVRSSDTGDQLYSLVDTSDVFTARGMKFDDNPQLQPQIATEGAVLRYHNNNSLFLEVVPGEQYEHGITLSDDLNNTVRLTLRASVKDNLAVQIDSAFSSCLSDEIALRGEPGQKASLFLQTLPPRQTSLELQVQLIDCPPGFILEDDECICDPRPYIGLRCDANKFYSYLSPGFWAGIVKHGNVSVLATGTAPSGFCDYNGSLEESLGIRLPRNISVLDEAICGKSRTGILCGNCREGYTTYFHSPDFLCKPEDLVLCKAGWLLYIVSELIPVTVMFVAVLALNINFTSGAINSFILFAQLLESLNVDSFGIITYPKGISILAQGYNVIYGFFNLDFFNIEELSYCLWPNASALDMLAFKYLTIVFALFLVVSVILIMSKCGGKCLRKWCRITRLKTSVIHGITAFLVICYAQCVKVSLVLLQGYTYALRRGNRVNVASVVFLNANLFYFTGKHLAYALPALLFLLTIGVVPPALLLAYPLLNKLLDLCGIEDSKPVTLVSTFLPVSSLKPLLDSFQGCFKDNLRFFAGLYFVYRWIPFIIDASTDSNSTFFLVLGIALVCILALHAVLQPYHKGVHNVVANLLLFDLAIINAISFGNYYRTRNYGQRRQNITDVWSAIQLVLIYIPAIALAVYVLIWSCNYYLSKSKGREEISDDNNPGKELNLKSLVRRFSAPQHVAENETANEQELPHRLTAPNEVEYTDYDRGAALRQAKKE